ncbi:hypothetical protein [Alteromonas lipotrueae]|uniref:hypothetical protein n=1 Tax=Alteromonas lipotrueae TaxID=2803814 RepID=UPI001C480561|nr:hypothetical protein [Alteromonas lipotrueae]
MKKILVQFLTLLFISDCALGASYKDTDNVNIHLISVWTSNGEVLVQTNPKHDVSGLSCTNNFWLVLKKDSAGYEATLSMLLSAQATRTNVTVRASDDNSNDFCRLSRLVLKPSN